MDLVLGGLLVGLAFGNHLLMLFVAPFVVAFVLWVGRRELRERPWLLVAAAGAGLLGLSVYLYIPIAASLNPPLPYNHPTTLEGVWWLVSGTQFRGQFDFFSAKGPGEFIGSLPALWALVTERATPVVPVLGVAGLGLLIRRRPAFGLTVVTILFFAVYIWANYLHLEHYLLVPWLVLALGVAVAVDGLAGLARRVAEWRRPYPGVMPDMGVVVGALAIVGAVGLASYDLGERGPKRRPLRRGVRRGGLLGAARKRSDPDRVGRVDAAVARPARPRAAAGRPDRRRHEHRVRGLGDPRGADRVGDLRAARLHPPAARERPAADEAGIFVDAVSPRAHRGGQPIGVVRRPGLPGRVAARDVRHVTEPEAAPRPAATVVLLRPGPGGPEVLLTRRPSTMAFAADMHVFPGGAVDPGDLDPRLAARSAITPDDARASLGGDIAAPEALARYIAALRELFEEAGVLLAEPLLDGASARSAREGLLAGRSTMADVAEELDLRLRTDLLVPIGHWTTPPIMARRFDTRFFVAELPDGVEPTFETDEIVGHRWETPRAALDAMAAGDLAMWVPTSATLQQLEHVTGLAEIRRRIVPGRVAAPRVIAEGPGLVRLVVAGSGRRAGPDRQRLSRRSAAARARRSRRSVGRGGDGDSSARPAPRAARSSRLR